MSQTMQIKEWLETGKGITALDALENFSCFRLAARIDDLRREGMQIETRMKYKNGKRYAEYGLERG